MIARGLPAVCAVSIAFLMVGCCNTKTSIPIYEDTPIYTESAIAQYDTLKHHVDGEIRARDYDKVAVYPFDVSGGFDYGRARYYEDLVEEWFVTQEPFEVVTRDRLDDVLSEQDLGQGGRLNPAAVARLREILGVKVIVHGSFRLVDGEPVWTLQLIDSETAIVFWAANGRGFLESSYRGTLSRLVDRTETEIIETTRSVTDTTHELRVVGHREVPDLKANERCYTVWGWIVSLGLGYLIIRSASD